MLTRIDTVDELLAIYGAPRVLEAILSCKSASVRDRYIVIRRIQGWTLRAIADEFGLHRETIRHRVAVALPVLQRFIVWQIRKEEDIRRAEAYREQYRQVMCGERFRMGESDKIDE